MPKVSICIPVHNGECFLRQAVESVAQQTYPDFEIIIVDNASADGTVRLAAEMAGGNSKIRLYKNESNLGLVKNFNACLNQARGNYVKFLCADDLLLPSCLERMVRTLDDHPAISLVSGGRLIVDENGKKIGVQHYSQTEQLLPGKEAINRCLFGANYIGEPTATMFRREAALRGFREEFSHLMDMEMWFHLLEQGELASLPDPLCAIRQHSGQMTVQNIKSGALVEDNARLFEEYGKKPYIRNTWLHSAMRKIRMAYRVWISRSHLDPIRRKEVLEKHSFPMLYYLIMPVFGRLLALFRCVRHPLRAA